MSLAVGFSSETTIAALDIYVQSYAIDNRIVMEM